MPIELIPRSKMISKRLWVYINNCAPKRLYEFKAQPKEANFAIFSTTPGAGYDNFVDMSGPSIIITEFFPYSRHLARIR